jgi:hypothetical protein
MNFYAVLHRAPIVTELRTIPVVAPQPLVPPPEAVPLYVLLPFATNVDPDSDAMDCDEHFGFNESGHVNISSDTNNLLAQQISTNCPLDVSEDVQPTSSEQQILGDDVLEYAPSDVESMHPDDDSTSFNLDERPACLTVHGNSNPGTTHWPGANETEEKFIQIFSELQKCMSRANLRKI